ncbi:hypothetical protein ACFQWF_20190 [Methylorubrum suomiense]
MAAVVPAAAHDPAGELLRVALVAVERVHAEQVLVGDLPRGRGLDPRKVGVVERAVVDAGADAILQVVGPLGRARQFDAVLDEVPDVLLGGGTEDRDEGLAPELVGLGAEDADGEVLEQLVGGPKLGDAGAPVVATEDVGIEPVGQPLRVALAAEGLVAPDAVVGQSGVGELVDPAVGLVGVVVISRRMGRSWVNRGCGKGGSGGVVGGDELGVPRAVEDLADRDEGGHQA